MTNCGTSSDDCCCTSIEVPGGTYHRTYASDADGGTCMDLENVAPVGTVPMGAGFWGHLDLAGDMVEWTLDWYAAYVDPCTDCANRSAGSVRVVRVGDFYDPSFRLLSTHRGYVDPTGRVNSFGVRCARSP
jgi:formylglycine-generating enzyme required for sulfatase activity